MKKNLIPIALLVAAIVLGVICFFLLPDVVAVQIGADGQASNTMPKALAIVIPLLISAAGCIMNLSGKEENRKKGYVLSVLGIALMVLTLFFNR
ncbi:MAG: DUF1648 domain-containing protein [Firmicutes bacterium]|nr:DUF1648 domain-containing protein [Bacillota bacterium]